MLTEYGQPFTAPGFGNWFKERCREAGLRHMSAHSLRKAALRRMAEAGCSEDQIAAVSGHRDTREIRVYVAAANRAKMANEGMGRTLASLAPAHSEPAPLGDVVQEAKEQSRAYRAGLLRELGVTAKEVAVARKAPTFDLVTRNGTDGDYNFVEVKWRNMVGVVGPGGLEPPTKRL